MSTRVVTITLAGILIAVFVAEMVAGIAGSEVALLQWGALRTRGWSGVDWWRVLTFSFLHLNAAHLTLNLAGLLWLGGIVRATRGTRADAVDLVGIGHSFGCRGHAARPVDAD